MNILSSDFTIFDRNIIFMSALTGIKKPVEKEMAEFEAYFSRTMRSEIPLTEYNSQLYSPP